ncbi:hypothetical protein KQI84_00195 [bacterium]|nr:hypothetical protein [bacterium]
MEKRNWSLSIALMAILLLTPVWGLAEVSITVGDGAGNPGDDITLSITFSGAEEPGVISAFSVFLDFDPRLLDVPSGSTQPTNPVAGKGADQPNVTILSRISPEEDPNRKDKFELSGVIISGPDIANGEIATLTFTIPGDLPDGYYLVGVTDTEVRDNLNVEVPSIGTSGTLTIGNPPTPTPSPTPSETPTPSPTPSEVPTDTPTATPSATPSDTPSPTPSDTPSPTPSDTPSPTPSDTPSPTPSDTPTATPTETPSPTPSDTPTPSPTPVIGAIISTTNVVGAPYAASGSYTVDIAVSNNTEGPVASYALRVYYDPASTEPTGIVDAELGGIAPNFSHSGQPQTDAQGTYMGINTLGNFDTTLNNLTLCTITFTNTASPAPSHSVVVARDGNNIPLIAPSDNALTVGAYDSSMTDPFPGGGTPTPSPTPSETPTETPSPTPSDTPSPTPTSSDTPTPSPTPVNGAIIATTNVEGDPYAVNGSFTVDIAVRNNIEDPVASYALRVYYDPASTEPTGIVDVDLGGIAPRFSNNGQPQTDAQGTYKTIATLGNLDTTQNNLTLCTITFTNTASPAPNHSVVVAPDPPNVPLISVSFLELTVGAYDSTLTDPLPGGATPTPTPTPLGAQGWYFW